MDREKFFAVLIVALLFGAIVFYVNSKSGRKIESIKKHLRNVPCVITKTETTRYRGGMLNIYVKYGEGNENAQVFTDPKTDCNVTGKIVPLTLDSENQENVHLLLKPDDFEGLNLTFPGSLTWAKECFARLLLIRRRSYFGGGIVLGLMVDLKNSTKISI